MSSAVHKPRVLMVGAFPLRHPQKIYGGQVAACMRLMASSFVTKHAVRTIDTTQITNPPPPFFIRLVLAARRLILFSCELLLQKPEVVILFLADGASACEKGLMARIAKLLRIRVMVFPRAGGLIQTYATNSLFAAFIRSTMARADMFLCQGPTFQIFAMEKLGFDRTAAPIIPNWTACEAHLTIGENRAYGKAKSFINLLFLGWLEDFKGVLDLLEALRMLHAQGVSFHLTLAGDGNALPEARRLAERYGLSNQVTFAGWVDEAAKAALLQSSDLFVLPSWSEGLPNAMIEAMSAGLACVLSNVGTIGDYVTDGREALFVAPRDPVALAEALKKLITNHPLRDTLGQNGHHLARTQFSLEQGAKRMSEVVLQLMPPNK